MNRASAEAETGAPPSLCPRRGAQTGPHCLALNRQGQGLLIARYGQRAPGILARTCQLPSRERRRGAAHRRPSSSHLLPLQRRGHSHAGGSSWARCAKHIRALSRRRSLLEVMLVSCKCRRRRLAGYPVSSLRAQRVEWRRTGLQSGIPPRATYQIKVTLPPI